MAKKTTAETTAAPEKTEKATAQKKTGASIKIITDLDSTYTTTINLNGKPRTYDVVKGVIETNDTELAEFLGKQPGNRIIN